MIAGAITVRREGALTVAEWGRGPRRCAVGAGGIGQKLREGDEITPAGRWPLRRIFYRADRIQRRESRKGRFPVPVREACGP